MGTKNNPSKFDCHGKAEPDEPTFTLLGRDPAAGPLVRMWAAIRMGNTSVMMETFATMMKDCAINPGLRTHIVEDARENDKIAEALQCGIDMSRYYFDKRDKTDARD